MVNRRGNSVTLEEAVDEIFSNQDELTNSTYVTLKLDDKGRCKIHSTRLGEASISDGDREIVTTERYVVMPWKIVFRHGKNVTLEEAVHEIISYEESIDKECERREIEHAEIEAKQKEYYDAHVKSETDRLNIWVDWYKCKIEEISKAPVDERLRALVRLYQISEANKKCGVTITTAGVINPVKYPDYPPELKLPDYNIREDRLCYEPMYGSFLYVRKPYNHLDYFRQIIRSYQGRDEDADKYVQKVKNHIDRPLDKIELKHIRLAMAKVKYPRRLDIWVFYQLTRRLPHEGLGYDGYYEGLLIHLYDTFCNESIKLLGCTVRCRTNVLYHLLDKVGKEPNADLFQFMKGPSHQ